MLALLGLGCDTTGPEQPGLVRELRVLVPSDTVRPGTAFRATALALDAAGEPRDAPVLWLSETPQLLAVDARGNVEVLAPGTGVLRASVGALVARRSLVLRNPVAATLELASDTLELTLPGVPQAVNVVARDSAGELLVGATITYGIEAPRIATVSAAGVVTPVASGSTVLRATLDGVQGTRVVRVRAAGGSTAPVVDVIEPSVILPGQAFAVRGRRFGNTAAGVNVLVDGLPVAVTSVNDTLLTAALPAAGLPCLPTRDVDLQVSTAGGVGAAATRLQVAPQRALAVGQALLLPSAAASACNELVHGEGQYLVSVVHTARALGAGAASFTVDLRSGDGSAGATLRLSPPPTQLAATRSAHALRLHTAHAAVQGAQPAQTPGATLQLPPLGGIVEVRVPDLDSPNLCSSFTPIRARTVYLGSHVAILEDTARTAEFGATLAGSMDAAIQALGAEVDQVIWPLVAATGDPLVMDSRLDANGRVVLLLTPRLNAVQGGAVLGAVVTCDFFPRAQFASSNVGEMLYLQVPTRSGEGLDEGTVGRWLHELRGTVAHELRHVVSYGERIVRGQPLEEPWLDEALARTVEERYARQMVGLGDGLTATYADIRCEAAVLLGEPACDGYPRLLRPHFDGLFRFLTLSPWRSPLGPVDAGDDSFYGSGWSLLRWVLDQRAGGSETDLLLGLTRSGSAGAANVELASGRSWDDILTRWSLALLLENTVGPVTADPSLQLPSWDLRDVLSGFCDDLGACGGRNVDPVFTRPDPLRPVEVTTAGATLQIDALLPGGFVAVDVAPAASGSRRLLRLTPTGSSVLPAELRLALVRVQ